MKRVQCSCSSCQHTRVHFEKPEVPRGIVWFDVPDDATGPFYCSLTCAAMSGAITFRNFKRPEER